MTATLHIRNGIYYAILEYKDSNGKRVQKWKSTKITAKKGNKKAAQQIMENILEENERRASLEQPDIQFCDYMLEWLNTIEYSIQPKTFKGYSLIVKNQIFPFFKKEKVRLCDVKPQHLQRYYRKKAGDGVSPNTILRHHANLHKALKHAVLMGMIESNPAEKVILPKKEKFVGKFYDKDELATLFEMSKDTTLETVIFLTAHYGLRRSEIMALRWQDVDFKNKTVSIRHKVVQLSENKGHTNLLFRDILKTSSSFRTFPLIPQVEQHLRQAQERQKQCRDFFKSAYNEEYSDYICVWPDGNIIAPNYTTRAFKELLEEKKLRIIRFHDLRHSCATLLLSLGFSIKEIQEWMGHGNYSTTADIYAHVEYKSKLALAEKLEENLSLDLGKQQDNKNPRSLEQTG